MNKKIITIAVASALAAPLAFAATATIDSSTTEKVRNNQDSVTSGSTVFSEQGASLQIGGRAESRISVIDGEVEDLSRVRLNFTGKVDVTDTFYGIGFYEGEFTSEDNGVANNGDINNRYIYAGFGGTYGEVTYGKTGGALGAVTDFTDIMAFHGGGAGDKLPVADRVDNMLAYQGSFSNLALKASVRFDDRTEAGDRYSDNDQNGYSASAVYTFGDSGFAIGGGLAEQDDIDQHTLGLSYEFDGLYLGGLYNYLELDAKAYGYEFAAGYTTGRTVFTSTYNNAKIKDNNLSERTVDQLAVDVTYYFKENFRTYASYNFNFLDGSGIEAEDEFALGLRYDF